jgi:FkbM family methyltransferase
MLKEIIKKIFRFYGKRITNYHAPAKPFSEGMYFLKEFIKPPEWIIDVGSADGTPDITDAFPFGEYKYLVIDPAPDFSDYLDSLKQKYQTKVVVEKCACGETNGTITLNVNKTGHYNSRYTTNSDKGTINVPMKTLDSLVLENQLTGPILLKIDVEGAEHDVLRGSVDTLKLCDVVIIETWLNVKKAQSPADFATIVTFMKTNGFVVFDFFAGHTNKSGTVRHVDTVFVKQDSPYRQL